MKFLSLFFLAMLSIVVAGCDGDGDAITPDTTTEGTETVDESKGPVTILTGSETIMVGGGIVMPFDIHETGAIEARVEWSSGPLTLYISLRHSNSLMGVVQGSIQSPALLGMQATQDLLDNGSQWEFNVENLSLSEQVTINYTVTFTPD